MNARYRIIKLCKLFTYVKSLHKDSIVRNYGNDD